MSCVTAPVHLLVLPNLVGAAVCRYFSQLINHKTCWKLACRRLFFLPRLVNICTTPASININEIAAAAAHSIDRCCGLTNLQIWLQPVFPTKWLRRGGSVCYTVVALFALVHRLPQQNWFGDIRRLISHLRLVSWFYDCSVKRGNAVITFVSDVLLTVRHCQWVVAGLPGWWLPISQPLQ